MADLSSVPQLNSNNVHTWRFKLIQHLRPKGLAQYIQKFVPKPDTAVEIEKWEKDRIVVLDLILQYSEDVIDQIVDVGGWDMDTQEDPKTVVDIAVNLFAKKKAGVPVVIEPTSSADDSLSRLSPSPYNESTLHVPRQQSVSRSSMIDERANPSLFTLNNDDSTSVQSASHEALEQDEQVGSVCVTEHATAGNLIDRHNAADAEPRIKTESVDERDSFSTPIPPNQIMIDLTDDAIVPRRSPGVKLEMESELRVDLTEGDSAPRRSPEVKPEMGSKLRYDLIDEEDSEDRLPRVHKKLEAGVPRLAVALELRKKAYEKFDAKRTEVKLLRQELDKAGPDAASALCNVLQQRIDEATRLRQEFDEFDAEAKRVRDETSQVYNEGKELRRKNDEMLATSMDRDINIIE